MKKKILILLLIIGLTFSFVQNVSASDETDINSFTIDVEATTGTVLSELTIKVNGKFEENSNYYLKFVNEGDSKPTNIPKKSSDVGVDRKDITKWKSIVSSEVSISEDWYLLNGYDYAYILKCNSTSCTLSDKPLKVNRPALPELSKRYQIYLFNGEAEFSVYPYFPYSGQNGSHEINVKIGRISDKNLLYKIYKNETGALKSLMDYAKDDSGTVYTCNDEKCSGVKIDNMDLVNGEYYYLYTNYKNDDELYRDLSDITIAQARAGVLSNDLEWNFDNDVTDTSNNTVTKNPSTNSENVALITVLLFVILSVIGFSTMKLKKVNKK